MLRDLIDMTSFCGRFSSSASIQTVTAWHRSVLMHVDVHIFLMDQSNINLVSGGKFPSKLGVSELACAA